MDIAAGLRAGTAPAAAPKTKVIISRRVEFIFIGGGSQFTGQEMDRLQDLLRQDKADSASCELTHSAAAAAGPGHRDQAVEMNVMLEERGVLIKEIALLQDRVNDLKSRHAKAERAKAQEIAAIKDELALALARGMADAGGTTGEPGGGTVIKCARASSGSDASSDSATDKLDEGTVLKCVQASSGSDAPSDRATIQLDERTIVKCVRASSGSDAPSDSVAPRYAVSPVCGILGGLDIADRMQLAQSMLDKVDILIIGGGLALTFLKAMGVDIGSSLYHKGSVYQVPVIRQKQQRGV